MRLVNSSQRTAWRLVPLASLVALAGCSADVIRLDSPASFGFNDKPSAMSRPSAAMTRSSAGASTVDLTPAPANDVFGTPPTAENNVRMAALPEPTYAAAPSASAAPAPSYVAPRGKAPGAPAAPAPASADKGEAITVKQGDTLFGLSKRHKVSIAELMSVNALASPNLKPGQTLYLPVSKPTARKPLTRSGEAAAAVASATPAAPAVAAAPVSAALAAKYDGSYTVKKGDSLYGLALQFKVPLAELQQVNGITDVRKVRPGAVLKVPASALGAATQAQVAAAPDAAGGGKVPPAIVAREQAATVPSATRPVLLNGEKSVAAIEQPKVDSPPVATAAGGTKPDAKAAADAAPAAGQGTKVAAAGDSAAGLSKLRWPAKGKLIGTFGPRPDGTHNDGVNISVPLGTDVHAAEGGVVVYAGNELKGYGNLVLIRHDNGWITAYAHGEELLAKRGDRVKRGQVVAKAGKSGQVEQPQIHFELRQGSKPVDPAPYLEKM